MSSHEPESKSEAELLGEQFLRIRELSTEQTVTIVKWFASAGDPNAKIFAHTLWRMVAHSHKSLERAIDRAEAKQ